MSFPNHISIKHQIKLRADKDNIFQGSEIQDKSERKIQANSQSQTEEK
jgi:hypothetical protein